jgi:hypothetical protein
MQDGKFSTFLRHLGVAFIIFVWWFGFTYCISKIFSSPYDAEDVFLSSFASIMTVAFYLMWDIYRNQ